MEGRKENNGTIFIRLQTMLACEAFKQFLIEFFLTQGEWKNIAYMKALCVSKKKNNH